MEKVMKRREGTDIEGPKRKIKKNTQSVPEAEANGGDAKAKPPPSEEEVEEFFAIVRRMHVAVKYFGKGHADREKAAWRAALETDAVAVDDGEGVRGDGEIKEEKRSGEEIGLSLDLNAVPEEAHAD